MVRPLPNGTEESIPLYEQYNHHHDAYVLGAGTEIADLGVAGGDASAVARRHTDAGVPRRWTAGRRRHARVARLCHRACACARAPQVAAAAFIVDGNGGEYKKSRHGTPTGFGILVQSPRKFSIQPMNINTRDPNNTAYR